MDPEYVQKIQEWVKIDNKILEIEAQIEPVKESIKKIIDDNKSLYDTRNKIENDIVTYIQKHDMDKLTINTGDGFIKFGKKTNTQTLSLKLLRSILQAYEEENEDINTEDIINFVINNLEKKKTLVIKRQIT